MTDKINEIGGQLMRIDKPHPLDKQAIDVVEGLRHLGGHWGRRYNYIASALRKSAEEQREKDATVIPTNWLDPMLTGDKALIGKPPYSCQDIERLLQGIAEAIRSQKP